jgi:uncharacterized protein YdaU (DUF1376 family)
MSNNGRLLAEWFWTDRWERSPAAALPIAARGLYREMLSRAWARGARLPNNPEAIRRVVGVTFEEWAATWPLVAPYWQATTDGLWLVNETQLEVYAEARGYSERASERGRRGARARGFDS